MPDPSPPPYHLDQVPAVLDELRELGARAVQRGCEDQLAAAIRFIRDRLKTDPLAWGDPEYHTVHAGGTVCHAFHPPLLVRYVVYEHERAVCILKISPLSGPLLSSDE